ncbi:hypothetical protein LVJ83_04785 [Uruburuella testudinis]|uniref:ArsR family transcriptional regulator n=1 Tax=Uruburuella testudinis TaxID=1282863 RepID=A0ABY4DVU6_9NEIS|nr:hypothetical protein [Uruburuella testudinis]UOO82785.1 hypothetical protein LVJ83_04785 [Uruburuella testudinis]
MSGRMMQLAATPCSAEYLADVLRLPLAEVQRKLARLEQQGLIRSKVLVTYQAVEIPTAAERKREKRLALRLKQMRKKGGV